MLAKECNKREIGLRETGSPQHILLVSYLIVIKLQYCRNNFKLCI